MNYEKLKDFLNENDRFCKFCGIKLTAIAAGYAEAEVEINATEGDDFSAEIPEATEANS